MTVFVVVLSLVVGYIRKGTIKNFSNMKIRLIPLIVIGLLIQASIHAGYYFEIQAIQTYDILMHFISYILLFAALMSNFDNKWFIVITSGVVLNFVVIFLNGGKMPIHADALQMIGVDEFSSVFAMSGGIHQLMEEGSLLWFFGKWIPLPFPQAYAEFSRIFSIGDIVVLVGIFGLIQCGMKMEERLFFDDLEEDDLDDFDYADSQNDDFSMNYDLSSKQEEDVSNEQTMVIGDLQQSQKEDAGDFDEKAAEDLGKSLFDDSFIEQKNQEATEHTVLLQNEEIVQVQNEYREAEDKEREYKETEDRDDVAEQAAVHPVDELNLSPEESKEPEELKEPEEPEVSDEPEDPENDALFEDHGEKQTENIQTVEETKVDFQEIETAENEEEFQAEESMEEVEEFELDVQEPEEPKEPEDIDTVHQFIIIDGRIVENPNFNKKPTVPEEDETEEGESEETFESEETSAVGEDIATEEEMLKKADENQQDIEDLESVNLSDHYLEEEEGGFQEKENASSHYLQRLSDEDRIELMRKMKERKEMGYSLVQVKVGNKNISFWKKDL